jgi:PTS system mannose-specific IIC component
VFFFILFSLARFGLNLGFLDRPLVIGMLWAAMTGQWDTALPVAIFFELFFLDLFPIGTYIPPHGPFALLTTLILVNVFELVQPPLIFLAMLLCMPSAFLGSRLEHLQRQRQNTVYTLMLQSTRAGHKQPVFPEKLAKASLLQSSLFGLVAFTVVTALLLPLADWLLQMVRGRVLMLPVTWPTVWMLGTIGALLSLRSRRVYAVLLAMVFFVGGYFWAVFSI